MSSVRHSNTSKKGTHFRGNQSSKRLFGNLTTAQTKIAIGADGRVALYSFRAVLSSTMTEAVFKDIPELFEVGHFCLTVICKGKRADRRNLGRNR